MIADTALRLWTSIGFHLASSTPAPGDPDPDSVTPGVVGFAITFLVAVATVLLIIDMTRRVRRTRYRAEIAAKLDAEEAEARSAADAASHGPASTR